MGLILFSNSHIFIYNIILVMIFDNFLCLLLQPILGVLNFSQTPYPILQLIIEGLILFVNDKSGHAKLIIDDLCEGIGQVDVPLLHFREYFTPHRQISTITELVLLLLLLLLHYGCLLLREVLLVWVQRTTEAPKLAFNFFCARLFGQI